MDKTILKSLNVALCVSGQMRTYRNCYNNLYEYILEPLDPDIFIHTWKKTGKTLNPAHRNKSRVPEADEIVIEKKLKDFYNAVSVVVEELGSEFTYSFKGLSVPKILRKKAPNASKTTMLMFYKMYFCNKLALEYETKYDLIIRHRPDMLFKRGLSNIELDKLMSNKNLLYYGDIPGELNLSHKHSDKFAIGNEKVIDYYTSVWDQLKTYWENPLGDGTFDSYRVGERLMTYHLNKNNIISTNPINVCKKLNRF